MENSNIPPYPSFSNNCLIAMGIFLTMFLLSLAINKYTQKKDPNNPNKTISRSFAVNFIILSLIGLIFTTVGCITWYNYTKRRWIIMYGSPSEVTGLAITDALKALSD